MLLIYTLAYLIGSIPTALYIGKIFFHIDIREHGSHNPGATNSVRVMGKKAGIVVLLIDIGKGALAASLPLMFSLEISPLYTGLLAVVGHCFPIFAGFRGGKAIATTAGTLIVFHFSLALIVYGCFFAVILITRYVFFGSLSVGITLLVYSIINPYDHHEIIFFLYLLLLIYLHRSNIINFIHKEEPKVTDKKLKKDRIIR